MNDADREELTDIKERVAKLEEHEELTTIRERLTKLEDRLGGHDLRSSSIEYTLGRLRLDLNALGGDVLRCVNAATANTSGVELLGRQYSSLMKSVEVILNNTKEVKELLSRPPTPTPLLPSGDA